MKIFLLGSFLAFIVSLVLVLVFAKKRINLNKLQLTDWKYYAAENKIKLSKSTYDMVFHDLFLKDNKYYKIWQLLLVLQILLVGAMLAFFVGGKNIGTIVLAFTELLVGTIGYYCRDKYDFIVYDTSQKVNASAEYENKSYFIPDISLLRQKSLSGRYLLTFACLFFTVGLLLDISFL